MDDNQSGYYDYLPKIGNIAPSPLLAYMWARAAEEWKPLK